MWFSSKWSSSGHALINPDYAPNKVEEAHFIRKFRKRRVRQRWLLLLFMMLPVIVAWAFNHYRNFLFLEGNWSDPSVITVVILGMAVFAEVAIIAISMVNWRCPHCENMAPFRPHPYLCKHCSAPLRFTKSSD